MQPAMPAQAQVDAGEWPWCGGSRRPGDVSLSLMREPPCVRGAAAVVIAGAVANREARVSKGQTPRTPREVQFWSDEAYAKFYNSSTHERRALAGRASGFGQVGRCLEKIQASKCSISADAPLERRTARFQQLFAEHSVGKGWIEASRARQLLQEMGLEVAASSIDAFVQELRALEGARRAHAERLTHDETLELYQRASMPTPPSPEKLVHTAMLQAVDGFADDASDAVRVLPASPPWSAATVYRTGSPRRCKPEVLRRPQPCSPRGASVFKRVGRFTVDPKGLA